jgi:amidohydrolase
MIESLRADAAALAPQLVEWRRDFHRHPELALAEHRTSAVLKRFLEGLGMDVRVMAGTGLLARLEGRPGGRTVALRADLDALPLTEEGKDDYASQKEGLCHACGHDGHMAILMGVARLLAARVGELTGTIVLLFQPAEERIPGGARVMIEAGALDGVDAIFGLHLWQALPTGAVGCVEGAMMASPDEWSVVLTGKGGHAALPHLTVDPISAAAQLVVALNSVVSRNVNPLQPAVLSFGAIHGGTAFNIIPGEVTLTGTVRTFDPALRDTMERRVREVVAGTCAALGTAAKVTYVRGYPALVNDPGQARLALAVARDVLGPSSVVDLEPVMGGEDFAYYLERVPGAFLFYGAGDGMAYPHHHPRFDIDERALPGATLLMAALALKALAGC